MVTEPARPIDPIMQQTEQVCPLRLHIIPIAGGTKINGFVDSV